jgi:hypothetical protein
LYGRSPHRGERAFEQVRHADLRGCDTEIVAIQPRALHRDNAKDIAPLAIGGLTTEPKRPQLLQQNVLGLVDVDRGAGGIVKDQKTSAIHLPRLD